MFSVAKTNTLNHVISTKLDATALPADGYIKTLLGSASTTNTLSLYVKKSGAAVALVIQMLLQQMWKLLTNYTY
jgi:hypothetical protein